MRLLLPGWEGNTNIKWLHVIKVTDKPYQTRQQTTRYTDLVCQDGACHARQFTFVMEAKSVVTSPSAPYPLQRGFVEIRGLAWSGRGTVSMGEHVYQAKCVACHGPTGTEGPMDKLVGEKLAVKTIGSFWPYATTIFDYIRRAQPFNQLESLADEEVYALTAWLLFKNKIIVADQVIDTETLPKVRMPNRDGFVPDPRPDVD
jgi:Cytochrome C oxidase, cbb3-type, subunit III